MLCRFLGELDGISVSKTPQGAKILFCQIPHSTVQVVSAEARILGHQAKAFTMTIFLLVLIIGLFWIPMRIFWIVGFSFESLIVVFLIFLRLSLYIISFVLVSIDTFVSKPMLLFYSN